MEAGIPEDDPRNPATIADNVGDNVGDVAGMGADLYESYVGSILATFALGASAGYGWNGLILPILLAVCGILCSIVGSFFVKTEENASQKSLLRSLRTGTYLPLPSPPSPPPPHLLPAGPLHGSFLTRTYLCRYPGTVDGAILSGTGQENALLVGAGKLLASLIARFKGPDYVSTLVNSLSLGAYNKQFKPTRTTADWISRDEGVVDQYLADPFCTFTPTVGMFRDMLGGLQYIASEKALSQMDPAPRSIYFLGTKTRWVPTAREYEGIRLFPKARHPGPTAQAIPRRAARDAQRAQQG